MTAADPAVALTDEELASLYRSAHGPNWRTDGAASVDRALLARVHAELTALRARVGEVERDTAERIAAFVDDFQTVEGYGLGTIGAVAAIANLIRWGKWKEHP